MELFRTILIYFQGGPMAFQGNKISKQIKDSKMGALKNIFHEVLRVRLTNILSTETRLCRKETRAMFSMQKKTFQQIQENYCGIFKFF